MAIDNPKSEICNPKWTILIVDDNPDDIEITKRALRKLCCEMRVEAVPRGEAALELLWNRADLPSLILLDLKMPGMSGFDVLRRIRADGRLKHIPVAIVTSSTLEADEKESYAAGANSFLHKAFDMDKFSRDVKSLLECWLKD